MLLSSSSSPHFPYLNFQFIISAKFKSMEYHHSSSSKHRIRSSMFCFTYHIDEPAPSSPSSSSGSDDEGFHHRRLVSRSSPSAWIRSRAHDLPEDIKEKCATFFSKIRGRANRRSSNTSEFRYDPMSYALNFDDDFPLRNFSSRLPASPLPESRLQACI